MTSDDYKSVDTVKSALGSIARLGRAAAVHLALACQRASGSTISTDLKNNIQILNSEVCVQSNLHEKLSIELLE